MFEHSKIGEGLKKIYITGGINRSCTNIVACSCALSLFTMASFPLSTTLHTPISYITNISNSTIDNSYKSEIIKRNNDRRSTDIERYANYCDYT